MLAMEMTKKIGAVKYMEVSAKTGVGLDELFEATAYAALDYVAPKEEEEGTEQQLLDFMIPWGEIGLAWLSEGCC
ncbi:hypothetical protein HDV00_004548 [Rhizophlyctis rosea]|nr:hypothetical protein HDV00_004548 [Rhizophlyctis rosea]